MLDVEGREARLELGPSGEQGDAKDFDEQRIVGRILGIIGFDAEEDFICKKPKPIVMSCHLPVAKLKMTQIMMPTRATKKGKRLSR